MPMSLFVLPNVASNVLARSQRGLLSVSRIFPAQVLWRQVAHQGTAITALAWSYEGDLLASSGEDAMIRIWQAASGRCLAECPQPAVTRLQWSSSGMLAAACADGLIHLLPLREQLAEAA